jgi:hypothetical protein
MSLSREEAAEHGFGFGTEDRQSPADPDQPHYEAALTIDGHTLRFQGKSEEECLLQAERALTARGRIERKEDE